MAFNGVNPAVLSEWLIAFGVEGGACPPFPQPSRGGTVLHKGSFWMGHFGDTLGVYFINASGVLKKKTRD